MPTDETRVLPLTPVPAVTTPAGRPVWYPDTAILTTREAAAVLDVDERTVRRYPIRVAYMSGRERRYLFRDLVAFLERRAA